MSNERLDDELDVARQNLKEYIQRKENISQDDDNDYGGNVFVEGVRQRGESHAPTFDNDKVIGYESDYLSSSNPGSYRKTEGSEKEDAQMVKSSTRNAHLLILSLD